MLTEETAATLLELRVAPDNEGVIIGQTQTLCVFSCHFLILLISPPEVAC